MITFGRSMDGTEIADKCGFSRQYVSQTLKRAMKKFYIEVKKLDRSLNAFDRTLLMMEMLNVTEKDDVKNFYHLFPPDIREDIRKCCLESNML